MLPDDGPPSVIKGHEGVTGPRVAAVAGLYVLVVLVMTWPLATSLAQRIPTGSEPPTVALHQLYLLEWSGQSTHRDFADRCFWDAPYFHPHRGTFAWSEPQPLTAVFHRVLATFFGVTLAYNLVLLTFLVLNACLVYFLARQMTDDSIAAFLAGAWASAGAYSMHQLGVMHLLALAPPAWFLLAVIRLGRKFETRALAEACLAYAATWLTCAQFGMFLTLLAPFAFLTAVPPLRLRLRDWIKLGVASLVTIGALLPHLLAQRARLSTMGFERTQREMLGSLHMSDLITPAKGHWLVGRWAGFDARTDVYCWDPGVVLSILLLGALCVGLWKALAPDPKRTRALGTHLVVSATALTLAFGPRLGVELYGETIGPYSLLAAVVPGLDGIRSPARLMAFVTLSTSAASAAALGWLRASLGRSTMRVAVTSVLGLLLLAEALTLPIRLTSTSETSRDWGVLTSAIASLPPSCAIIELPLPRGGRPADFEGEVRAMRRSLSHGHPVANGYSAYFPTPYWELVTAMSKDPAGRGLRFLQALGVSHAVIDEGRAGDELVTKLVTRGAVETLRSGPLVLIRLPSTTPSPSITLPSTVRLRRDVHVGDMIRVGLNERARAAALLDGSASDRVALSIGGTMRTLRVHGTTLVDEGASSAYVLVTRLDLIGRDVEGRLISEGEMRARSNGIAP